MKGKSFQRFLRTLSKNKKRKVLYSIKMDKKHVDTWRMEFKIHAFHIPIVLKQNHNMIL